MLIERLMRLALLGSEWVLYLLLFLSVLSIATMVERWIFFVRRAGSVEQLRRDLTARLERGDVAGAEQAVQRHGSVQARVAAVALRWLGAGPDALTDAVEAELARVRRDLEKGSNLLGTLGNNAPFVGLFGTVLGVIIAFHALGDSGGNADAMGGVMAGIAEALVATGVGLFVALPAVVAYNLIQKKIAGVEDDAAHLVKLISAYAKAHPSIVERARELHPRSLDESTAEGANGEKDGPRAHSKSEGVDVREATSGHRSASSSSYLSAVASDGNG